MRSIPERIGSSKYETITRALESMSRDLRVASPGIIKSFNASTQTVTVQLALREKVSDQFGNVNDLQLPLLVDVPIVIPRAGGFAITLPVQQGDECLVIFSDTCIDSWFSNGGVQVQAENRRHDLSDGFAILGTWSQPNRISGYSTSQLEIKCETADAKITIDREGDILIRGRNVTTQEWG